MAIPLIAAGIGALGSVAAGGIGAAQSAAARKQSLELINESIKDLEALGIPTAEAQRIALEEYKSSGDYTPEIEQAVLQGDSAYSDIDVDPTYKSAQLAALDDLKRISDEGGLTGTDLSNMEQIQGNIDADERGAREAIASNLKSQGAYGSGLQLAQQLQNQQDAATRSHSAGLQVAGGAQDRALQALQARGSLAGDVRGQEFGEQGTVAGASDAIARFNAANRQDVQSRNVGSRNVAQERNLSNAQSIGNANVDTRNQQEIYNKELLGKEYQDKLAMEQTKANLRSGQATQIAQGGRDNAAMWGKIGQGVGQVGSGVADYYSKQPKTPAGDTSSSVPRATTGIVRDFGDDAEKKRRYYSDTLA